MLIRVSGYNDGAKEYLEEGVKKEREFTRDELDERVMLLGNLDLTQKIYQQIPDNGQERYVSITMSFFEEHIPVETMKDIAQEYRQFLMYAYRDDEYNFYAEAHLPKIKQVQDKKTGEMIDRKPHIHMIIPEVNLLSGNVINPRGNYTANEKYFEAFQEYINQKYNLVSPRERVRVDPTNAADVLSRYKGDDFNNKNREFKQQLVRDIIDKNITTRNGFYDYVASFGETRIRNKGGENEYIAVKLPEDKKFTNLKESIFCDDFIVHRELKKPPLDKNVIYQRLQEWPQRSYELKYVSKASEGFRHKYRDSSPSEKLILLEQRKKEFYQTYGGKNGLYPTQRESNNQRSIAETESRRTSWVAYSLQSMPGSDMATDGKSGFTRPPLLLPGDASFQLGQPESTGGDSGLRHDLRTGRRGRRDDSRPGGQTPSVPGIPPLSSYSGWSGSKYRSGLRGIMAGGLNLPPYAGNPRRKSTTKDVEQRSQLLLRRSTSDGNWYFSPARKQWPHREKNASYVAAWFLRQSEQNQILPAQKRAIRSVDSHFFTARRLIFQDERLTRSEKTQLLSVLTFERLKAHRGITRPEEPALEEIRDMGSEDIRKLIKEKSRTSRNSIAGDDEKDKSVPPAGHRFSRIVHKLKNQIEGDDIHQERQKKLTAADLYTRRSKLTKNVHYKDKKTDRTLFVDTGTAIAVRREGMSSAALTVALELAKERFGSTLNIKGTAEFKQQVIDVVAKNGLDIHFTSKEMNRQLEERKAELATERDGQAIEQPGVVPEKAPMSQDTSPVAPTTKQSDEANTSDTNTDSESSDVNVPVDLPFWRTVVHLEGKLIDHGRAPLEHQKGNVESYFVTVRDKDGNERTHWSSDLQDVMKGRRRGQNISLEQKESRPVEVNVRDEHGNSAIREAVRREWSFSRLPNDVVTKESDSPVQGSKEQATEIKNIQEGAVAGSQDTKLEDMADLNMIQSGNAVDMILSNPTLRNMAMTAGQKAREFNAPADEKNTVNAQINAEIVERFKGVDQEREPLELILSDTELRGMALSMEQKMREQAAPLDKLDAVVAEINGEVAARVARLVSVPIPSSTVAATVQTKDIHAKNQEKEGKPIVAKRDKVHEGVLVDSGAAPYKFKPDMNKPEEERNDSFYVKLKMEDGKTRTLWGVGLENVVRDFQNGERVKLKDKGVEPVTWKETLKDGRVVEKSGDRRIWEGTSLTREAEIMKGFRVSNMEHDNDGPDIA
ncbi:relaxase [Salmonella enterica]|nr:relaxase [Salmonella enterica]